MLAGQDHYRLGEHLQTDGTDELLLQTLHDAGGGQGAAGETTVTWTGRGSVREDGGDVPEVDKIKKMKQQREAVVLSCCSWTLCLFLDRRTSAVAESTCPYMSKVTRRCDRAGREGGRGRVSKQHRVY